MNVNSLKKCLWLGLVLAILGAGLFAFRSYKTEVHERKNRFYSKLALLDPKGRVELGEEIERELHNGLPAPYSLAILERKAELYRQAMERNANLDRQQIPQELAERTFCLRSPIEIDGRIKELKDTLIKKGRLNWEYLEAQRQLAMYGPFINRTSYSMAEYLAGKIDYANIWWWFIYLFAAASTLAMVMFSCRAAEQRVHPLLLIFLPMTWVASVGAIGMKSYFTKVDREEVIKKALNRLMGLLSTVISVAGGGYKVFAQEKPGSENLDTKAHAALVTKTEQNAKVEVTCNAATANQFHAGFVGAIFRHDPVFSVSCSAKRIEKRTAKGVYGSLWLQEPMFGKSPGATAREIDVTVGYMGRLGQMMFAADVTWANPAPLKRIGRGDVLIVSLQATFPEKKAGKAKITPWASIKYATPIKGNSPGRGWIGFIGTDYSLTINRSWSVTGQAKLIRDFGVFGFPKAYLGYGTIGLNRSLGKGITLTLPSVVASTPFTANSNRGTYVTIGASISKSW